MEWWGLECPVPASSTRRSRAASSSPPPGGLAGPDAGVLHTNTGARVFRWDEATVAAGASDSVVEDLVSRLER